MFQKAAGFRFTFTAATKGMQAAAQSWLQWTLLAWRNRKQFRQLHVRSKAPSTIRHTFWTEEMFMTAAGFDLIPLPMGRGWDIPLNKLFCRCYQYAFCPERQTWKANSIDKYDDRISKIKWIMGPVKPNKIFWPLHCHLTGSSGWATFTITLWHSC